VSLYTQIPIIALNSARKAKNPINLEVFSDEQTKNHQNN